MGEKSAVPVPVKQKRKVIQKESSIEVSATILDKTKKKHRKIAIRPFVTDTATVGINCGLTKPMPDGSYMKLNVFLSCPCYVEEMLDVYKQVRNMAEELLENEVDRMGG